VLHQKDTFVNRSGEYVEKHSLYTIPCSFGFVMWK